MSKRIMITGATDGIGLETAKMFAEEGHQLIVHGRNKNKLEKVIADLKEINGALKIDGFIADLSKIKEVRQLIDAVKDSYTSIDVLINNAGVFVSNNTQTEDGLELRFAVNTVSPYLLSKELMSLMRDKGRIVNLSSAAQGRVDLRALANYSIMSDSEAYAQSKLALTMWSIQMGLEDSKRPAFIAVNPKSFLGSKMVKQAYGRQGHDLRIGADILYRAALSEAFEEASGKYFDNDYGAFADPHPDALREDKRKELIKVLDELLTLT